jgi:hypothetical protein
MNITNRSALWDLGIHKIEVAQCTLNFTSQWLYLWRSRCPWRIERHEGWCIWNAQWILCLLVCPSVTTVACRCNISGTSHRQREKYFRSVPATLVVDYIESRMIRGIRGSVLELAFCAFTEGCINYRAIRLCLYNEACWISLLILSPCGVPFLQFTILLPGGSHYRKPCLVSKRLETHNCILCPVPARSSTACYIFCSSL